MSLWPDGTAQDHSQGVWGSNLLDWFFFEEWMLWEMGKNRTGPYRN